MEYYFFLKKEEDVKKVYEGEYVNRGFLPHNEQIQKIWPLRKKITQNLK